MVKHVAHTVIGCVPIYMRDTYTMRDIFQEMNMLPCKIVCTNNRIFCTRTFRVLVCSHNAACSSRFLCFFYLSLLRMY